MSDLLTKPPAHIIALLGRVVMHVWRVTAVGRSEKKSGLLPLPMVNVFAIGRPAFLIRIRIGKLNQIRKYRTRRQRRGT